MEKAKPRVQWAKPHVKHAAFSSNVNMEEDEAKSSVKQEVECAKPREVHFSS